MGLELQLARPRFCSAGSGGARNVSLGQPQGGIVTYLWEGWGGGGVGIKYLNT